MTVKVLEADCEIAGTNNHFIPVKVPYGVYTFQITDAHVSI